MLGFIFVFIPSKVLPTLGGLGFLLISVSFHDIDNSGVGYASFRADGLVCVFFVASLRDGGCYLRLVLKDRLFLEDGRSTSESSERVRSFLFRLGIQ